MEQSTVAHYKVKTGEAVQLSITATKVNNPPAVSLDGLTLAADPADPWRYSFKISKKAGSQALEVVCSFDATAPADAFYAFTLQGNQGCGAFDAGEIEAGDPDWSAAYTFFVA